MSWIGVLYVDEKSHLTTFLFPGFIRGRLVARFVLGGTDPGRIICVSYGKNYACLANLPRVGI